jgi:hypothetical protein
MIYLIFKPNNLIFKSSCIMYKKGIMYIKFIYLIICLINIHRTKFRVIFNGGSDKKVLMYYCILYI